MARFTLKEPIKFVAGTGFTISPNNTDINLTSPVQVVFSIGQDISKTSVVTFNQVTASQFTVDNNLSLVSNQIDNLSTIDGNLIITNDFTNSQNLNIKGNIVAEKFTSELTQSVTIFKSGSTQFGDTGDDVHGITGSLSVSGSFSSDGFTITEISNDTALTDGSSESVITENALKTYLTTETEDFQNYLRKSFAHTGSFVNLATSSFTAVTASAPSGIATTTVEDFMFFNNGAFMETDALTIQQSGSKMFLLVNNDAIGYDLANSDEIVAFGKFNS